MTGSRMRSPAPRGNAEERAEAVCNNAFFIVGSPEPEANFGAIYLSRRYGLALSLALTILRPASFGRAFG
jgi:hypothetical protein